jgi:hypothetical protein
MREKVRGFGDYLVLSECGPYQMWQDPNTTGLESSRSMLRTTVSEFAGATQPASLAQAARFGVAALARHRFEKRVVDRQTAVLSQRCVFD